VSSSSRSDAVVSSILCHIPLADSRFEEGRSSGDLRDRSPPVESRGKTPVGDLGDEVPQKPVTFLRNCSENDDL